MSNEKDIYEMDIEELDCEQMRQGIFHQKVQTDLVRAQIRKIDAETNSINIRSHIDKAFNAEN